MAETAVVTPGQKGQGESPPPKPWFLAVVLTGVWAALAYGLYRMPTSPGSWWVRVWSEALGPAWPVTPGMALSALLLVAGSALSFTWVDRHPERGRALIGWFRDFRKHCAYYQPGQGTATRRSALGLLGLLALYGAFQGYDAFDGTWDWWSAPLGMIPLVDFAVSWGKVICAGVFVLLLGAVYLGIVNQPKLATFLIEVEGELKKVSWPAKHEYWGTSVVVLVTVVILGVFLVLADTGSRVLMEFILPSK